MSKEHKDPQELDLTKPRLASYEKSGKGNKIRCIGSIYNLLNRKDLSSIKQDRTQSSSTIHSQLIVSRKLLLMNSREIIYQQAYVSPRPPPKISYKDNWMCDLDSDIAGRSKDIQRIEPKPNTQLSSTGRPVCGEKEEIEERTKFDRDTLNQEKQDEVTDPTSTGRDPYVDTNPQNVAC